VRRVEWCGQLDRGESYNPRLEEREVRSWTDVIITKVKVSKSFICSVLTTKMIQNLAMLEGKSSNVLLLQFTARLCSQKMRNGEKIFSTGIKETNFCNAP
jgi:hypothetical protein